MSKSKKDARAGEFWSVNDAKTRGHKSLIVKRRKDNTIMHIPSTHKDITRNMRNIRLIENPDSTDVSPAYILPRTQITKINNLGKYHPNMKIINTTDKAVVRNIKKKKR